jgi:hypothetical protein
MDLISARQYLHSFLLCSQNEYNADEQIRGDVPFLQIIKTPTSPALGVA